MGWCVLWLCQIAAAIAKIRCATRTATHSTGVESATQTSSNQKSVSPRPVADDVFDLRRQVAQPSVVAGLAWQVGEQVVQVGAGVAQPAAFAAVAEQRLRHGQADQFRVGQPGCPAGGAVPTRRPHRRSSRPVRSGRCRGLQSQAIIDALLSFADQRDTPSTPRPARLRHQPTW
jgi:hypothetical protein